MEEEKIIIYQTEDGQTQIDVRSALVRLCENNVLIRVAQGIYYYPKIDTKWGSGLIPPSIEEIAKGIAKRDKKQSRSNDSHPRCPLLNMSPKNLK